MRERACLAAVATILLPAVPAGGAAPAVTLENPVFVRAVFPPGDTTLPAVVAATALPRIRSTVGSSTSTTISADSRVERSTLGPDVLPDAPFPWTASLQVQCNAEEVTVVNEGEFLGDYTNWSALPRGEPAPDGWQGTHFTSYHQGGAVVFPEQPDRPGGRLVATDHMLTDRPVLPRSSCGADFDGRVNVDFHRVTLTADGGDVSFQAGDELGEVRMRMLPAWQGSMYGWFDPPGKRLIANWRPVTNPTTGDREMNLDITASRPGLWRESLPTPIGRTWEWSVSGFNMFGPTEDPEEEEAATTEARASLRVLPGQTIVHMWPEDGRIRRRHYVSPGLGTAVLAGSKVRFEDMIRLPLSTDALRAATGARPTEPPSGEDAAGKGEDVGAYCTRSIDRYWEEARLCMGLGIGPGGFPGLTHLSIDEHARALTAGLTHVEVDGVRSALRPDNLVDGPTAVEYQYESGNGQDPGTILYVNASYALADARFTVSWLFINDAFYGRILIPIVSRFRSSTATGVTFSWHLRPTPAEPAETAVYHGWSGVQIGAASSHAAKGEYLTGPEWFSIRRAQSAARFYYVPSAAGHLWSGLAWASHDSTTTFLNWTGDPTPTPVTDAPHHGLLGPDIGIHKQDFYESFYMARAYGGSYGMILSAAPFAIGF